MFFQTSAAEIVYSTKRLSHKLMHVMTYCYLACKNKNINYCYRLDLKLLVCLWQMPCPMLIDCNMIIS